MSCLDSVIIGRQLPLQATLFVCKRGSKPGHVVAIPSRSRLSWGQGILVPPMSPSVDTCGDTWNTRLPLLTSPGKYKGGVNELSRLNNYWTIATFSSHVICLQTWPETRTRGSLSNSFQAKLGLGDLWYPRCHLLSTRVETRGTPVSVRRHARPWR